MDTLLSDDEKLIKNTIKDYSNQEIAPRASNYDLNNEFPWKNIQGLAELGMFGLTIEEKYGGTGEGHQGEQDEEVQVREGALEVREHPDSEGGVWPLPRCVEKFEG